MSDGGVHYAMFSRADTEPVHGASVWSPGWFFFAVFVFFGLYLYWALNRNPEEIKLRINEALLGAGESFGLEKEHLQGLERQTIENFNAVAERNRFRKPSALPSKENQIQYQHQNQHQNENQDKVAQEAFSMEDIRSAINGAMAMGNGTGARISQLNAQTHGMKVHKVRSDVDGRTYFVASELPEQKKAANKLAEISRRAQTLLQSIDEQLDGNRRVQSHDGHDVTDNMRQLVKKHYNKKMVFAEYHNPNDKTVGSNSEKGEMIETCLRNKKNPSQWTSDNTLFRIHMHELAHSADFEFRADGEAAHGPQFKRLHKYLLTVAENLGIYSCEEYKRSGKEACGLQLTEDYCGNE